MLLKNPDNYISYFYFLLHIGKDDSEDYTESFLKLMDDLDRRLGIIASPKSSSKSSSSKSEGKSSSKSEGKSSSKSSSRVKYESSSKSSSKSSRTKSSSNSSENKSSSKTSSKDSRFSSSKSSSHHQNRSHVGCHDDERTIASPSFIDERFGHHEIHQGIQIYWRISLKITSKGHFSVIEPIIENIHSRCVAKRVFETVATTTSMMMEHLQSRCLLPCPLPLNCPTFRTSMTTSVTATEKTTTIWRASSSRFNQWPRKLLKQTLQNDG